MTTKDQNNAVNEGHLIIKIGNVGETIMPQTKEQFGAFYLNSNNLTSQFNAETTTQLLVRIEEFFWKKLLVYHNQVHHSLYQTLVKLVKKHHVLALQ